MNTRYSTFEDWFAEQEGFSVRAERFDGDVAWLKAAFEAGRSAPAVLAVARKENRVSDERLSSLLDQLAALRPGPVRMAPNDVPDLLAALDELQSLRAKPVAGVSVKPLVWKRRTEGGVWRAETLIGEYRVWTHHEADGAWFWNLTGGATTKSDRCLSEEAAKAAAEADYRQRILSALSVADQEPMIWQARDQNGHWVNCVNKQTAEHVAEMNGGEIRPLYASPQPTAVITEERVERAMASIEGEPDLFITKGALRYALEAAMKEA